MPSYHKVHLRYPFIPQLDGVSGLWGCIAVDMECSGLQAVCDYRGYEYYTFFYTGDLLDAPEWEQRILANEAEKDHQLSNFLVALEIAAQV